jgi:hypothetical protein
MARPAVWRFWRVLPKIANIDLMSAFSGRGSSLLAKRGRLYVVCPQTRKGQFVSTTDRARRRVLDTTPLDPSFAVRLLRASPELRTHVRARRDARD